MQDKGLRGPKPSWVDLLAGARSANVARSSLDLGAMVSGVGGGSLTWFVLLSAAAVAAGRKIGDRGLRTVDAVAGVGLVGFAALLAYRLAAA